MWGSVKQSKEYEKSSSIRSNKKRESKDIGNLLSLSNLRKYDDSHSFGKGSNRTSAMKQTNQHLSGMKMNNLTIADIKEYSSKHESSNVSKASRHSRQASRHSRQSKRSNE